ncbi:MAG: hypothetical protein JWN75_131 [Candidatus Saccharibacteria bacterium]|nr:hypothetical protein [Candidatus Saccharibacteria bacterium]
MSNIDLRTENYGRIRYAMVEEPLAESPAYVFRTPVSFAHHMARVAARTDIYLFTANSAVPVADSVRGYYEELGHEVPTLGSVKANSYNSRYRTAHNYNDVLKSEQERLAPIVEGGRVTIVDQYVSQGLTLRFATRIAQEAGAISVDSTDNAEWYTDASVVDAKIDLDTLTSAHKDFMHKIGRSAAQAVATNPDILIGIQPERHLSDDELAKYHAHFADSPIYNEMVSSLEHSQLRYTTKP